VRAENIVAARVRPPATKNIYGEIVPVRKAMISCIATAQRVFNFSGGIVKSKPFRAGLFVCAAVLALAVGASAQTGASTPQNDPNMKEIFNYTLTMDKIHKLTAVENDMEAYEKAHPELGKEMEADNTDGNLDQMAQKIQKYPPVVAILKKDGVAPREYIVSTLAVMQAGMAVSFKKSGVYKDYPPKILTVVNPSNLAFMEKNWDEISKTMPAFHSKDDNSK
jgi:hypothetical protein